MEDNVNVMDIASHNSNKKLAKKKFYNRRSQSEYLRNAFPAGFQLNQIRTKITHDDGRNRSKTAPYIFDFNAQPNYSSFTAWTKGDAKNSIDELECVDDADPYVGTAGPYLAELLNSKNVKSPNFDRYNYSDNENGFEIVSSEIRLNAKSKVSIVIN
jgi:hypothetical protein